MWPQERGRTGLCSVEWEEDTLYNASFPLYAGTGAVTLPCCPCPGLACLPALTALWTLAWLPLFAGQDTGTWPLSHQDYQQVVPEANLHNFCAQSSRSPS